MAYAIVSVPVSPAEIMPRVQGKPADAGLERLRNEVASLPHTGSDGAQFVFLY